MSVRKEDVRIENIPGELDSNFPWSIVRARPDKPTMLTLVGAAAFGLRNHFFRGRTTPCLRTGCEACKAKMTSRWNGYHLAVNTSDGAKVVLEYTPPAAEALKRAAAEFGTLRGLNVVLSRTTNRANARVNLLVKGPSPYAHKLPPDEDVWEVLSHIFGLLREAPAEFAEFSAENLAQIEIDRLHAENISAAKNPMHRRVNGVDLPGQLRFDDLEMITLASQLPLNGSADRHK